MPEPGEPTDREINQLVERLWPRIQELFAEHGVPAAAAETIVEETILALLFRWRRISRPEYWLLKTIEERCAALAREQGGGS